MQTDALALAAQSGLAERLTWGVIEFQVTDLDRAVTFWTTALGLHVREHNSEGAALGTEHQTLFTFRPGATIPVSPRHLGMYHVALGVPTQAEFSRLLARLIKLQIPVSPVDHLMSKAIYLSDPDGLEIEIALETPERFSRFDDMTRGLVMYDVDGRPHNGRESLDLDVELSFAQNTDLEAPLSNKAFVAHMHFKVEQLEAATRWFEGIGFARNLMLPDFGLADMGTGSAYTHRLAMNIWAGPNLRPAPSNMAKLTHYSLHVNDAEIMANIEDLQPLENGLIGFDPTGTKISLIPAF